MILRIKINRVLRPRKDIYFINLGLGNFVEKVAERMYKMDNGKRGNLGMGIMNSQ